MSTPSPATLAAEVTSSSWRDVQRKHRIPHDEFARLMNLVTGPTDWLKRAEELEDKYGSDGDYRLMLEWTGSGKIETTSTMLVEREVPR